MPYPECRWRDLGRLPYGEALAVQKETVRRRISGGIPDTLLFVEHPPVITLGKVSRREHLVAPREGVQIVETDRGGDVTYHGPGQLVGYPVVDLQSLRRDVKWYLERLEEVLIRAAARFRVTAARAEGMTGAWVGGRKLAAIGVRVERWVTSHGFALNVTTDLGAFDQIIPCGLAGKGVTSLARETGRDVALSEAREAVTEAFGAVFGREMIRDDEGDRP
ncbi:MAG TPA: lipoyl(octanoyl) transferase LipB [Planctomycetota bacterium]|nr:lipoyl(octanoyl) transferase LipB [Planctomycetota bacterium]